MGYVLMDILLLSWTEVDVYVTLSGDGDDSSNAVTIITQTCMKHKCWLVGHIPSVIIYTFIITINTFWGLCTKGTPFPPFNYSS